MNHQYKIGTMKHFWHVVETRLKMFHNFNGSSFDLPHWAFNLHLPNVFYQTNRVCSFLQDVTEFYEDPLAVVKFSFINSPRLWIKYHDRLPETLNDTIKLMSGREDDLKSPFELNLPSQHIHYSYNFLDCLIGALEQVEKSSHLYEQLVQVQGFSPVLSHQIVRNLYVMGHIKYDENYMLMTDSIKRALSILQLPDNKQSVKFLMNRVPDSVQMLVPQLTDVGKMIGAKECRWSADVIATCLTIYQSVYDYEQNGVNNLPYKRWVRDYEVPQIWKTI